MLATASDRQTRQDPRKRLKRLTTGARCAVLCPFVVCTYYILRTPRPAAEVDGAGVGGNLGERKDAVDEWTLAARFVSSVRSHLLRRPLEGLPAVRTRFAFSSLPPRFLSLFAAFFRTDQSPFWAYHTTREQSRILPPALPAARGFLVFRPCERCPERTSKYCWLARDASVSC